MARTVLVVEAAIERLQNALDSGVLSVSNDGTTTTFQSADQMRRRLIELQSELAELNDEAPTAKPRFISVGLGGCM